MEPAVPSLMRSSSGSGAGCGRGTGRGVLAAATEENTGPASGATGVLPGTAPNPDGARTAVRALLPTAGGGAIAILAADEPLPGLCRSSVFTALMAGVLGTMAAGAVADVSSGTPCGGAGAAASTVAGSAGEECTLYSIVRAWLRSTTTKE